MELIGFLALSAVVAIAGSALLHWWRPGWSRARLALVSALPVPVALAAYLLWIMGDVVATPANRCGTDACGMALMVLMAGLALAAVGYGLTVAVAAVAWAWLKK